MTPNQLNDEFGLPGVLTFTENKGLTRAQITTPACEAEIYLHGAHLTHWQPENQAPVLFLSNTSEYAPNKAIRGGIPVCFPWFGGRSEGLGSSGKASRGGAHGFARTAEWTLAFVALSGEDLHLTFTLTDQNVPDSFGFNNFRVAYEIILGRSLTLRYTVANTGSEPLHFEEALHTYFAVEDVRSTSVNGLQSTTYLDKTDNNESKTLPPTPLTLTGFTDWVFPGNAAEISIQDVKRLLTITKKSSDTTVVWNPWEEKAAALADLAPGSWRNFLCVEAANAGTGKIVLAPQQTHTMVCQISLSSH